MLCSSQRLLWRKQAKNANIAFQAFFSRKSNNDSDNDVYKLVRSQNYNNDVNSYLGSSPNWELLAPQGYRFYMPGSVGPAWQNESTTANVDYGLCFKVPNRETGNNTLKFTIQECPILLREGVGEMFPAADVGTYQLTVVTLKQSLFHRRKLQDVDELAKGFLLAARDICCQLKTLGYWADFINPFSGHPYYGVHSGSTLFTTDQRFRCLGFHIETKTSCKVISPTENGCKLFVGSLFTTAPADIPQLREVLDNHIGMF